MRTIWSSFPQYGEVFVEGDWTEFLLEDLWKGPVLILVKNSLKNRMAHCPQCDCIFAVLPRRFYTMQHHQQQNSTVSLLPYFCTSQQKKSSSRFFFVFKFIGVVLYRIEHMFNFYDYFYNWAFVVNENIPDRRYTTHSARSNITTNE